MLIIDTTSDAVISEIVEDAPVKIEVMEEEIINLPNSTFIGIGNETEAIEPEKSSEKYPRFFTNSGPLDPPFYIDISHEVVKAIAFIYHFVF